MKRNRILLLIGSVALTAGAPLPRAAAPVPPRPAATPAPALDAARCKAIIDKVIAAIAANYVYPERAPAIAAVLRRKLSSAAFDTTGDPAAFARAVTDTIAVVANDRHLRLRWSPKPLPPVGRSGTAPDPAELARMQAMMARRNFGLATAEVLDGNIGYLKIDLFARAQRAGPVLASAMAFLQRTDALIFDLRDNGGGDPEMVAAAISYLLPARTEINRFHQRGQVADERIYTLTDVPGGRWSIDKPVYVLTSKRTASGAEEFAYDLQQLKRATIVGETTWGGANPGDFFPIDEHFALFVPTGAAVNPISGKSWEGVGVKPGIATPSSDALQAARRLALETLVAGATGDRADELREVLADKPANP